MNYELDCHVSLSSARNDSLNLFLKSINKMDAKAVMLPIKIEGLVEKIIEKKRSKVDSLEEEREIDRGVYGLYNLNDKEIKIIEGE